MKKTNITIGAVILIFLLAMMTVSIFYTPYPVTQMNIKERFSPPSLKHFFGTDNLGVIYSRVMSGSEPFL